MIPQTVQILTGSRLHFGPLSHCPDSGRHFGGIGMMVRSPGVKLVAKKSDSFSYSGSGTDSRFLDTLLNDHPEWDQPVSVCVEDEIPTHQGLGSGTQLGMAVTDAVAVLNGEVDLTAEQLARCSHRGQRSAVGLHGYLEGGFLVDAGHQSGELIGQIACRTEFPQDWVVLLVTPNKVQGMHGDDEKRAFTKLSPMSQQRTERLSHLTLTEILPSVRYVDFQAFARAISTYGELVGEFFSPIQGGIFSHAEMDGFVARLKEDHVEAVAQSSWGPTVAIFVANQIEADRVSAIIREDEFGQKCLLRKTYPMNTGRKLLID